MKPHEDDAHKTGRSKMDKITGSPRNFESRADKAYRLAGMESGASAGTDNLNQPRQAPDERGIFHPEKSKKTPWKRTGYSKTPGPSGTF